MTLTPSAPMSVEDMLEQFRRMRGQTAPTAISEKAADGLQPSPAPPPMAESGGAVAQDVPGTSFGRRDQQLSEVALDRLQIDIQQPRQVLPADLRRAFATRARSAQAVITELVARAAAADAEAQGHLRSLRELADSIGRIGLEQPLQVVVSMGQGSAQGKTPDGVHYVIKDGERRFWACVLRADERASVPVLIQAEADSGAAAQCRQAQWEINTQREDIPAVDVACLVRDTYRSIYLRVQVERDAMVARSARDGAAELTDSELAVALTAQAILEQTGRTLGRRMVFTLVKIADSLGAEALALARAHRLALRDLLRLGRSDAESQAAVAHAMAERNAQAPIGTPQQRRRSRPTRAQREVSLCQRLIEQLTQRTPVQLARLADDDLRQLAAVVCDAREALNSYDRSIQTALRRSG